VILEGPSLLHAATVHQRTTVAQLLIDLGINLNLRDVFFVGYAVRLVFSKFVCVFWRFFFV
jgi:hypothetical protein